MNLHHLELFYYVAKHGGISQAVRNMPYGIQQPAVSGQLAKLEHDLGVTLFQRRPFAVTAAGAELFAFIQPFFDQLAAMETKLSGGSRPQLRVGASELVLRDYLPQIFRSLRQRAPGLRLSLREGYQPDLIHWLQEQQIDFAVTLLEGGAPPGLRALRLLQLPLALVTRADAKYHEAKDAWANERITEPLITLPEREPIVKNFQQGMNRLGVDWFTTIEVTSLELIETYVENGFGIGLGVIAPGRKPSANLRWLPLPGFRPVSVGALWLGVPSTAGKTFLAEVKRTAERLKGAKPG